METGTPELTGQDLQTWMGASEPIPGAATLLRSAALLVGAYTAKCRPVAVHADAVRDATLAQAAYWHTNSITPLQGGVPSGDRPVQSASLLSGSFTFAGADKEVEARAEASTTLCAEAVLILQRGGWYYAQPIAIG